MNLYGLQQVSITKQIVCGWCGYRSDSMKGLRTHNGMRHKGKAVKVQRKQSSQPSEMSPSQKSPPPEMKPANRAIQKSVGVSKKLFILICVRKRVDNIEEDRPQHLF